jgi:hypothetical protein
MHHATTIILVTWDMCPGKEGSSYIRGIKNIFRCFSLNALPCRSHSSVIIARVVALCASLLIYDSDLALPATSKINHCADNPPKNTRSG